ncbi:hypothetical protein NKH77_19365 [Streptomyces sp. M19]
MRDQPGQRHVRPRGRRRGGAGERTVEALKASMGEEHPTTLVATSNLAIDLRALRRIEEAEVLHASAVRTSSSCWARATRVCGRGGLAPAELRQRAAAVTATGSRAGASPPRTPTAPPTHAATATGSTGPSAVASAARWTSRWTSRTSSGQSSNARPAARCSGSSSSARRSPPRPRRPGGGGRRVPRPTGLRAGGGGDLLGVQAARGGGVPGEEREIAGEEALGGAKRGVPSSTAPTSRIRRSVVLAPRSRAVPSGVSRGAG